MKRAFGWLGLLALVAGAALVVWLTLMPWYWSRPAEVPRAPETTVPELTGAPFTSK